MKGCPWSPDLLSHQDSSWSSEQHSTEQFPFDSKGIVFWTQTCTFYHQDTSHSCHVGSSTKKDALCQALVSRALTGLSSHIFKRRFLNQWENPSAKQAGSDGSRALVIYCCKDSLLKHSGLGQFTVSGHSGAEEPPLLVLTPVFVHQSSLISDCICRKLQMC